LFHLIVKWILIISVCLAFSFITAVVLDVSEQLNLCIGNWRANTLWIIYLTQWESCQLYIHHFWIFKITVFPRYSPGICYPNRGTIMKPQNFVTWYDTVWVQSNNEVYSSFASIYINPGVNSILTLIKIFAWIFINMSLDSCMDLHVYDTS